MLPFFQTEAQTLYNRDHILVAWKPFYCRSPYAGPAPSSSPHFSLATHGPLLSVTSPTWSLKAYKYLETNVCPLQMGKQKDRGLE